MDYHLSSDDLVHHPGHMQMPNVMEVVPTSDDEAPGSPSTPGSGRRYVSNGRAMSSPNIGNINADGASMSAADKKRNKLGYHRTAVACGKLVFFLASYRPLIKNLGHCRRRKIRCIPALDDTSGRCSNCIRLKKECQFFPVDQPNTTAARKGRSNSSKIETSVGEGDISASSSEPGAPHILRSSTEDSVGRLSENRTPVSPEEQFQFQRMGRLIPFCVLTLLIFQVIPILTRLRRTARTLNPRVKKTHNFRILPPSMQQTNFMRPMDPTGSMSHTRRCTERKCLLRLQPLHKNRAFTNNIAITMRAIMDGRIKGRSDRLLFPSQMICTQVSHHSIERSRFRQWQDEE
jgi:hypothetical protein